MRMHIVSHCDCRRLLSLLFFFLMSTTEQAWSAAVQGAPGMTSQGSTQLQITVIGQVRVTDLQDMQLGTFSGTNSPSSTQPVCIYSNDEQGDYTITLTTTSGDFLLQGPAAGQTTHSVPFQVFWRDDTSSSVETQVQYNTVLQQTGGHTVDDDCVGTGTNASIRIAVQSTDLQSVLAGVYNTTLVLVVGQP